MSNTNYKWIKDRKSSRFFLESDGSRIVYNYLTSKLALPTNKNILYFNCDSIVQADFLTHKFIEINGLKLNNKHYK